MSPPMPCASITLAASRETRNEPRAITSCSRSQSATVVSVRGLEIDRPALFTTRSRPPKASAALAIAAAMSSSLVTSAATGTATSAEPMPSATAFADSGVPVGDHDAGALGGQPLRGGPADA